jgi:hypothetical protein
MAAGIWTIKSRNRKSLFYEINKRTVSAQFPVQPKLQQQADLLSAAVLWGRAGGGGRRGAGGGGGGGGGAGGGAICRAYLKERRYNLAP